MDYVCLLLFLFSRVLEVSHPNLAILFIHSSTQAAFLCKKLDYDLPSSQKISPCLAGQVLDVCQRPCHIFVLVWALAGRSENKTNPRFFKSKLCWHFWGVPTAISVCGRNCTNKTMKKLCLLDLSSILTPPSIRSLKALGAFGYLERPLGASQYQ